MKINIQANKLLKVGRQHALVIHWKKQWWYCVGENEIGNVLDKEIMMMHWKKRQW
jgi:hypothetical protein